MKYPHFNVFGISFYDWIRNRKRWASEELSVQGFNLQDLTFCNNKKVHTEIHHRPIKQEKNICCKGT